MQAWRRLYWTDSPQLLLQARVFLMLITLPLSGAEEYLRLRDFAELRGEDYAGTEKFRFNRYILGLYRDSGKENGNYRDYRGYKGIIGVILGLYRDSGKENGNYYNGLHRDCIGISALPAAEIPVQWQGACRRAARCCR